MVTPRDSQSIPDPPRPWFLTAHPLMRGKIDRGGYREWARLAGAPHIAAAAHRCIAARSTRSQYPGSARHPDAAGEYRYGVCGWKI